MATIRLTNRNDTFTDKPVSNTIYGLGGDDRITGNGSYRDKIFGDDGNDTITGRAENTEYAAITAYGGNGNDRLTISGNPIADGGAGADILELGGAYATAKGGSGNDQIFIFSAYFSYAAGQAGNDRIIAESLGGTELRGETGNDTLDARATPDVEAFGGDGNDLIISANLEDAGVSTLRGGFGVDTFVCGRGEDTLIFDDRDSGVGTSTSTGRDTVRSFEAGTDSLNLGAWDANAGRSGDQAFTVVSESTFTAAGQLIISGGASDKIVKLNTDADRAAEAEIRVTLAQGSEPFTADDFIL